ncbi:MAG: hypothetical protein EXS17_07220 [Phycisphaerales bacterium]|nr:hypothetical protein [Phycisphaerales bacterium]
MTGAVFSSSTLSGAIRRGVQVIALATALLLSSPLAHAQDAESNAPRHPAVRNLSAAWVGYAAMALIVGLVITISLMPSKRGHQE